MQPKITSRPQVAFMVLGWLAFFWGWSFVLGTVTAQAAVTTLVFIVVSLAINVAIVASWITHNVRLFARKGPRKGVRNLAFNSERDFLGRRLVGDWDELRTTNRIAVVVQGDDKRFFANRAGGSLAVVADPGQTEPAL
ncbi:MAG: hypothetical protein M3346_04915 [Actinomycetota bacterium]|nr:hypothetical protein [Actinomycetota bacterium]